MSVERNQNARDAQRAALDKVYTEKVHESGFYKTSQIPPLRAHDYAMDGALQKAGQSIPADFTDKIQFSSGATSGGSRPRYQLLTWTGVDVTAERFAYGNDKHEDGQTVLADANWLKAFHARDLKFFQDRINHAQTHLRNEAQGRFDSSPGGNWGAVGWCVEILTFVQKFDPIFYMAVVGRIPHPGLRTEDCTCERCALEASR